jgi:two-component system, OmpR family, sensor histidine kinase KdpD
MKQIQRLPGLSLRAKPRQKQYAIDSILAIVSALLITGLINFFHLYPRIPDISLAYLLVILTLASTRGLYSAVLASVVAFLSFDFFMIPPFYTFTVAKYEEWLALFVFLVTAITTSQLAAALRRRAEQARTQEHETRILYELMQATNREENLDQQLDIIARTALEVFSPCGMHDCTILLPNAEGKLQVQGSASEAGRKLQLKPDEQVTASWVMLHAQTVELYDSALVSQKSPTSAPRAVVRSTSSLETRRYVRMVPLMMGKEVVGVMRLLIEDNPRLFDVESRLGGVRDRSNDRTAFFWAFVDQAAAVIERARLRQESLQIEVLRRTDALRAALLSSVSHDLRTPLSSIKAAASSLLQHDVEWDEESRSSFLMSIERQADRLNRLVENLLDMSRIEAGALKPEKEWYPIDELIHDVLGHMAPQLQGRVVERHLPDDLPPVELDYLEIDQVLTNLIENAVRYTPPESAIEVSAEACGGQLEISVADRGPGIPPGEIGYIFDKFYRVRGVDSTARTTGSGLGLAVCKGLVEAHGGRIWAKNRAGGGAIFRFTLPIHTLEEGNNI